jgi:hypothetical protein
VVILEIEVRGDVIRHFVNGEEILHLKTHDIILIMPLAKHLL